MKKIKMLNAVLIMAETILLTTLLLSFYLTTRLENDRYLFVPQGSIRAIVTHLQKSGLDLDGADVWMIRLMGSPQQGWIDLGEHNATRWDFYRALVASKAAMREIRLIPGETTPVTLNQLSEALDLNASKLHAAYQALAPMAEGVLIPETYHVPMGIDETGLIRLLIDRALKTHEERAIAFLGSYEMKQWFRYITMASIIEKEAANHEEMPVVASVIVNRLKKGMRLQMDGTLNYGYFSRERVTAKRIREDTSPYNTYKYGGLPPLPVCMVGPEAIAAALAPAQTDYLYFVRNRDGTHTFTHSYRHHLNNIKSE
ncbi:MAG: endolytic transglycosylase MltG [Campylobacterales bacterium]